jgi:hypothetical protein
MCTLIIPTLSQFYRHFVIVMPAHMSGKGPITSQAGVRRGEAAGLGTPGHHFGRMH